MIFPSLRSAARARASSDNSSADEAASAPLREQLVVERIEGATVVGWAVASEGRQAVVELWVDGEQTPARVEAVHRLDALDALGLDTDVALGFRLHLPQVVWSPGGAARAVDVRAGAQSGRVPLPERVERLVESLRDQPALTAWEDRFIELAAHVHAVSPSPRPADAEAAWLEEQVAFRGGWHVVELLANHPGARLRGHIESIENAVVRGWACLDGLEDEAIRLVCNGRPVDCAVIRVERDDVQRALQSDRRRLGFEVEIPATVWAAAPGDQNALSLVVLVAGRRLQEQPLHLSRAMIVTWLDRQRDAEVAAVPDETAEARRERQYAALLVMEHVAAAGLWNTLDARQRAFASTQAERYGVAEFLGADAVGQVDQAALADAALHDYATVTVWQLVREFNARLLADPSRPLDALETVLGNGQASGTIRQRFLWSVIPFFCGTGQYPSLRPHLEAGRLRALSVSASAWELSLLLPEAAACSDWTLAHGALSKIAAGATGWLNTECVASAMHAALDHADPQARDSVARSAFLGAFLDLLQSLSEAGYWSRLHDARLIEALMRLLASEEEPDATVMWRAEGMALRCYALVPDFWSAMDREARPVGGWSPALLEARACWDSVRTALQLGHAGDDACLADAARAVAWLRANDNIDADIVARELSMALLQRSCGEPLHRLAGLLAGRNEALRLAALPAATGGRPVLAPSAALQEEIRALADVPGLPRQRTMAAMVGRCMAAGSVDAALSANEVRALRALSQRDGHYVGVRLACAHWLRCRDALPVPRRLARLIDLREGWLAAFDACIELPQPPAALIGSYSLLEAALIERADEALDRVVAEMRRLLLQRYGESVLQSAGSACASPALAADGSGRSTLVAIYSCRRNLSGRVQAIRDTWAGDLDRLGIPWIVVVGDGDGRLQGNVLGLAVSDAYEALPAKTLALVDWVHRNTRFEHLLKIDDDCHLAAEAYFAQSPYLGHHYHGRRLHRDIGGTNRVWHQSRASTERAARSADKSPEPSIYADGGAGYCLSRHAMAQIGLALQTTGGARLTRSAYLEDKLLGDLLATRGIGLSSHGHYTLIRRRFGADAVPVNAYDNLFYPSRQTPTLVTHLDGHADMPAVHAAQAGDQLLPARIWPTSAPVRLGGEGTNQLELLSPVGRLQLLDGASVLLVAVARNERTLAPHFLQHYRKLGVRAFVFVDNLSDDGTREYLAAQPDVVLYSADTEYKHSHYGVSWQQAVLGAHALGKWVLLADLDEFLVFPGCEQISLDQWVGNLEAAGHDAARVLMVDMYPAGDLDAADFSQQAPFEAAPCFDRVPVLRWAMGSGAFSNGPTYLSALRHRLIPDSAPNLYTSQKLAVFKYQPWVRLSEGLHYASNLRPAPEPVWFAHFKYHAGFRRKVLTEVARKQHFNGAEEYRKYAGMLAETDGSLVRPSVTATYSGSMTWVHSPHEN
ncbi:MAG TPA: glycosyltransferase family 2 protein [Ideonella sp.]|uniref:glycosyltransferase family 2 protein n=1 Tax=Ideonella sp. TaxID=1929293 RepID=UPI002E32D097|nr:glycosyltransferase family 2 protein [Ideonella sp.]HEX5687243.1 glycosyltransferase family 2 protein [Ideonella sp.]